MDVAVILRAMQAGRPAGSEGIDRRRAGLTAIIARLYSLKGQGGDADAIQADIALAVGEVEKEVALRYPFFTLAEVQFALEEGVKGVWDDGPTYLSVANYCRWLRLYRHSRERAEAAHDLENGRKIERSHQLAQGDPQHRIDAAMPAIIAGYAREIEVSGRISATHVDGACAAAYDWLRRQGQMPCPTAAQIQDALSRVQKLVERGEDAARTKMRAKRVLLSDYLRGRDLNTLNP